MRLSIYFYKTQVISRSDDDESPVLYRVCILQDLSVSVPSLIYFQTLNQHLLANLKPEGSDYSSILYMPKKIIFLLQCLVCGYQLLIIYSMKFPKYGLVSKQKYLLDLFKQKTNISVFQDFSKFCFLMSFK